MQERSVYDFILFESEHFVATPTIGSLVKGWVLIISKQHCVCMGAIAKELYEELEQFKNFVGAAVKECYGPIAIFEHGPAYAKQAVGCGVDHAHIHIMPTDEDLVRGLQDLMKEELDWDEVTGICDTHSVHTSGREYLYIEQPAGFARLVAGRGFGSQLFRRVIAHHLEMPEKYDWKQHYWVDNARQTVDRMTRWRDHNEPCGHPYRSALRHEYHERRAK